MKAIIASCIVGLILAASVGAATQARDPRVPALQHRVAILESQVQQIGSALNHNADLSTCQYVYQSHFNYAVLNLFAIMLGQSQTPDRTPSDNGACSRVGLQPPSYLASINKYAR